MNGLGMIKHERTILNSYIPIFMLSSKDQLDDNITCLESNVVDYLMKPFNPGEFKARLRSIYRRKGRKTNYT